MNIDEKIEELTGKQPTSDNLNLLGDLYLKKGDKKRAIDYFYLAARHSDKHKAVAIYKKILRFEPSETTAYEAVIEIFAQSGLDAEHVKYLSLLAQVYHSSGDSVKETSIYRRIAELDPTNKAAEMFFSRGKTASEEVRHAERHAALEGEAFDKEATGQEALPEEQREGFFEKWKQHGRKAAIVIAAIVAVSVIVASVFQLAKRMPKKEMTPTVAKGPASAGGNWDGNTKCVGGNTCYVEISRLPDDLVKELPFSAKLSQKELKENGFFEVKVSAINECISEDLVKDPYKYISFFDGKDNLLQPKSLPALEGSVKAVYRQHVCNKKSGIVYAHFYLAYPRKVNPRGLVLDGVKIPVG